MLTNKLPVDEGYYLSNEIMGYHSEPPDTEFNYESSIPFDNQGSMYVNFGILGLILGGLITGIVYAKTYNLLKINKYHPIVIVISQVILYNFSMTSHDMVNVCLLIGTLILPLYFTKNIIFQKQ